MTKKYIYILATIFLGSLFVLADHCGMCCPYSSPVGNLKLLHWFKEELDVWPVLAGSISVDKMLVGISHGSSS